MEGDLKIKGLPTRPVTLLARRTYRLGPVLGRRTIRRNGRAWRAGFRLRFRRALPSVIVRELITDEVDLVYSAATITRERRAPEYRPRY